MRTLPLSAKITCNYQIGGNEYVNGFKIVNKKKVVLLAYNMV